MKSKQPKIYYWVKRLPFKNSIFSKFVALIMEFFRTPYIKAILPAVLTIVISLEVKLTDLSSFSWKGITTYPMHIVITIFIYIIIICINVTVDKYSEALSYRYKFLKEAMVQQTGINHQIGGKLKRAYDNVNKKSNYKPTKNDVSMLSYQDLGLLVCYAVYNIIKTVTGEEGHQVTLVHKFKDRYGSYYIKMIAYSNKNDTAPPVFNTKYRPEDNQKYFHLRIFEDNINKQYILKNRDEITKEFVENETNKERDSKLQQFVAIPIYCEEKGIISLLQIDTDVKGLMGDSREDIEEFTKVFMPFVHQLLANYNRENLINCLIRKIDNLSKKKEEA